MARLVDRRDKIGHFRLYIAWKQYLTAKDKDGLAPPDIPPPSVDRSFAAPDDQPLQIPSKEFAPFTRRFLPQAVRDTVASLLEMQRFHTFVVCFPFPTSIPPFRSVDCWDRVRLQLQCDYDENVTMQLQTVVASPPTSALPLGLYNFVLVNMDDYSDAIPSTISGTCYLCVSLILAVNLDLQVMLLLNCESFSSLSFPVWITPRYSRTLSPWFRCRISVTRMVLLKQYRIRIPAYSRSNVYIVLTIHDSVW